MGAVAELARCRDDALAQRYRAILQSWQPIALDVDIAASAARLRASLRLKLADAVQAASALAINAVAPGLVRTPMTQFLVEGVEDPSTLPVFQAYALRRMGEVEEIANAVLFLTSAESSLITGSALAVDAGRCYH